MIVRHLIVLVTLATQVAVGIGGGAAYLCRMDGEVRSACCCPEHPSDHAGATSVEEAACCDSIAAAAPERFEAELQAYSSFVGLPLAERVQTWDALRASNGQRIPLPEEALSGVGTPLFIRIRTLLI